MTTDHSGIVLQAFNEQLTFRQAYGFQRPQQVLDFIDQVIGDPGHYGVVAEWQPHLSEIRRGINELRYDVQDVREDQKVNGGRYEDPSGPENNPPGPNQQDWRQHTWRGRVRTNPQDPLDPVQHTFVGQHLVSSIYDLMAIFLSVAPAAIGATRNTFYLPWTYIYVRWVNLFTNARGTIDKFGKRPTMFQCTWRDEDDGPSRFFIGVVLSGQAKVGPARANRNLWVKRVRQARFAHLSENRAANGTVNNYEYGKSPEYEAQGNGKGWNFGNCAETHPFVELVQPTPLDQRHRCHGFAVRVEMMADVDNDAHYTTVPWWRLAVPCLNCQFLINNVYQCQYWQFVPLPDVEEPIPFDN